ncbi:MAG: DoxX family protein [Chitinophagaceae bacterium]|nr:DoxX family protein [Chitinophagaceae bacterium]
MTVIERIGNWGDTHHPRWVDIIRMALGLFLCYKGIDFLRNMSEVEGLVGTNLPFSSFVLVLVVHYVVFAHLMGGILLALGTMTRLACLVQIPILIGAVIFINSSSGFFKPFSELGLSILVLALLIWFLVVGNGPWSVDKLMGEEKKKA